jgi:Ca2+-binding RTX toxin-like protein
MSGSRKWPIHVMVAGALMLVCAAMAFGDSRTIHGTSGDDCEGVGAGTLYGHEHNDAIYAGSGDDCFDGREGGDLVIGAGGTDIGNGGEGADFLYGRGGNDQIVGNLGDDEVEGNDRGDEIVGGPGRDKLRGGRGPDVVRAHDGESDYVNGGFGDDLCFVEVEDHGYGNNCERVIPPCPPGGWCRSSRTGEPDGAAMRDPTSG